MPQTTNDELDVVIVGAGFSGLYLLYRLRRMGLKALVLEAGNGVGGTWYWNRYPGARCDIESAQYSFSFSKDLEQEWDWSERYATQPEILRYAEHVVRRFDLASGIRFNQRVSAAAYRDETGDWCLKTADGESYYATFCVMATGCLSSINVPKIEGLGDFAGPTYHTGQWPHEGVDFNGRRVGVIGTGSSAIQAIPVIANQAAELTVFQRTPNYVVPARNYALQVEERHRIKANYPNMRARAKLTRNGVDYRLPDHGALEVEATQRDAEFERRWQEGGLSFLGSFNDLLLNVESNAAAQAFIRSKIREIVRDQDTAEALLPTSTFGCKRLCIDSGYFETFNRSNVRLVDVSNRPIERIVASGARVGGEVYGFDDLVLATGFDAMTGALGSIDIRGRGGRTLREKWQAGPRLYLGLAAAGFPNLFTVTGPGSPSVLSNMLFSIEHHVDWISDCIAWLRRRSLRVIEAREDAEDAWVAHVNEVAENTLYPSCNSWYLGANVPGKTRIFMPYIGVPPYVERCRQVVARGYEGFSLA